MVSRAFAAFVVADIGAVVALRRSLPADLRRA
jgi:hypothetical protein